MALNVDSTSTGLSQTATALIAAIVCTLGIVYGLMVPVNYQPISYAAAVDRFRDIPYLNLGIQRRADWVANILLFVPFGWLWTTALTLNHRSASVRCSAGVAVTLAGCILAVATEFMQIWFPPRTVSLNDIYAECLGSLVGAVLAVFCGPPLWRVAAKNVNSRDPRRVLQGMLGLYGAGLLVYSIMPLDVIVSGEEFWQQFRDGKVTWGAASTGSLARDVLAYFLHAVTFMPIGVGLALSDRDSENHGSFMRMALPGILLAIAVEAVQLLLFSRFTQVGHTMTGSLGVLAGVWVARRIDVVRLISPQPQRSRRETLVWTLIAVVYAIAITVTTLWPLQFDVDWNEGKRQLLAAFRWPFAALYWGSEFQALTHALTRAAAIVPMGFFLRRVGYMIPLFFGLGWCVGLEGSEAFRSDRLADLTDLLFYWSGLLLGYFVATRFSASRFVDLIKKHGFKRLAPLSSVQKTASRSQGVSSSYLLRNPVHWSLAGVVIVCVAFVMFFLQDVLFRHSDSNPTTWPERFENRRPFDVAVGTRYTSTPLIPYQVPQYETLPVPKFLGASAIWGATGVDHRGHIWFGVSSSNVEQPSAHLCEYVPRTGKMTDHGGVVEQLHYAKKLRTGEQQAKIHTRIVQAEDGYLYFASTDEAGENPNGKHLPTWGSHLWRYRPTDPTWEHLASVPERLIALSGGGQFIYALGLFGHVLYQFDTINGQLHRVEVGSVRGHISRNLVSDRRGHVWVPRLRSNSSAAEPSVTLVEFNEDLIEIGETNLPYYWHTDRWSDHGITGYTHLVDESIVFSTAVGYLYRIIPRSSRVSEVRSLGWLHPQGRSYAPSLFTYSGRTSVVGLIQRENRYYWATFLLDSNRAVIERFPLERVLPEDRTLLYGSMTRDQEGSFYIVGRAPNTNGGSHYKPIVLRLFNSKPEDEFDIDAIRRAAGLTDGDAPSSTMVP